MVSKMVPVDCGNYDKNQKVAEQPLPHGKDTESTRRESDKRKTKRITKQNTQPEARGENTEFRT